MSVAGLKLDRYDLMTVVSLGCPFSYQCHHAFCHCTDDVTALACLSDVHSLTKLAINFVTTLKALVELHDGVIQCMAGRNELHGVCRRSF
jgi:hypothetical protein